MGPLIAFILLVVGVVGSVTIWSWLHDKLTRREEVDMQTFDEIMAMESAKLELEDQIATMLRGIKTGATRKLLQETLGVETYTFYLRRSVKRC